MLVHHLRYALRQMQRSPGFTAVAVLSLALGTGASTAIYGLFYTVMIHPLPVAHPEQLVEFLQDLPDQPRSGEYWDWASYQHFQTHSHVLSALTGTSFDNLASVHIGGSDPETLIQENVAGNYFQTLGLKPVVGRLISPEDVPARGRGRSSRGELVLLEYEGASRSQRSWEADLRRRRR